MIGWDRVRELFNEVGEDGFGEIMELFLDETAASVDELPNVANENLQDAMHALKGCALNLGFRQLASLCASGETRAAQGLAGSIDRAEIVTCYITSQEEFKNQLDKQVKMQ
jgi:HPt (histidine-containing phosphotransfer) domain-containing protein